MAGNKYIPPTPAAINEAIEAAGLTQSGFARMIHVDPRTVRRWISGGSAMPYTAWHYLKAI